MPWDAGLQEVASRLEEAVVMARQFETKILACVETNESALKETAQKLELRIETTEDDMAEVSAEFARLRVEVLTKKTEVIEVNQSSQQKEDGTVWLELKRLEEALAREWAERATDCNSVRIQLGKVAA